MNWTPYRLICCAALFLSSTARAEYRVHLLKIQNLDTETVREVTSTLDQYQYPEYHPVSLRELVTLEDHWMCYGRTGGFEPLCPRPELVIPRVPAQE